MDDRAREDIALVRRMMEESRTVVVDRGKHFMIWGLVPTAGLLFTYARLTGSPGPDPRWIWIGLLIIGWAASLTVGLIDGRRARVGTLPRRLLSVTWIATGISMTMIGLAGLFGPLVGGEAISGLLAAILGAPVFVTAVLTGERWLRWVAIGWWAGGTVMLFSTGPYALLLMAAMMFLLLAVPGAVLFARARTGADRPGPRVTEPA